MAGRSRTSPSEQAPSRVLPGLSRRTTSSWTVLAVFVIIVILLLWLRFALALQIASTGRQIQIRTEELQKLKRTNAAIQREIAEAESPRNLAQRAYDLGYEPQTPLYLPLSRPLSQPGIETGEAAAGSTSEASSQSMWAALASGLGTWAQAKNTP